MQLTHSSHIAASHSKEIILICDQLTSPANAGSLFRLADAFGVQQIIFGGILPDITSGRVRRTARNTEKIIPFSKSDHLPQTIASLHKMGFQSIALEITASSIPIANLEISSHKIALIIGSERHGIHDELLELCTHTTHIPMYGANSSMNVAQAGGIALYELTRV